MSASVPHAGRDLWMSAEELKAHMAAAESVTVLDVRSPTDWTSSPIKIRGAIRVNAADWEIDPKWPRDRLTVVY